jgi:hypothetical protein
MQNPLTRKYQNSVVRQTLSRLHTELHATGSRRIV